MQNTDTTHDVFDAEPRIALSKDWNRPPRLIRLDGTEINENGCSRKPFAAITKIKPDANCDPRVAFIAHLQLTRHAVPAEWKGVGPDGLKIYHLHTDDNLPDDQFFPVDSLVAMPGTEIQDELLEEIKYNSPNYGIVKGVFDPSEDAAEKVLVSAVATMYLLRSYMDENNEPQYQLLPVTRHLDLLMAAVSAFNCPVDQEELVEQIRSMLRVVGTHITSSEIDQLEIVPSRVLLYEYHNAEQSIIAGLVYDILYQGTLLGSFLSVTESGLEIE